MMRKEAVAFIVLLSLIPVFLGSAASADLVPSPAPLQAVRFDQRLNEPLPLDTPFVDESGRAVLLGDFFGKKPVLIAFVYYECPMLCTLVLNGLLKTLRALPLTTGKEFELVALSIDPTETAGLAKGKLAIYTGQYGRPGAEKGWHFLVGKEENIRKVADAAGFRYAYDEESKEYAHASGFVVATPEGKVAKYFFGIEYSARDLKWALIEASQGKIGSIIDQILLFCYHYDPATGKYGFWVMGALRFFGIFTAIAVAAMIVMLRLKERIA